MANIEIMDQISNPIPLDSIVKKFSKTHTPLFEFGMP